MGWCGSDGGGRFPAFRTQVALVPELRNKQQRLSLNILSTV